MTTLFTHTSGTGTRAPASQAAQTPQPAQSSQTQQAAQPSPSSSHQVLLQARSISFAYKHNQPTFQNVSFDICKGEMFSLLGPNGAGKSTLLNCLSGIDHPYEGTVLLNGTPITRLSPREVATMLAYVPQHISTTYAFSVREYLAFGAAPRLGVFTSPGKDVYQLVDSVVERLGLQPLVNRRISELSGGECQRVAIGRAIVQQPSIILFDEPTSALDYGNQLRVLRCMRQLLSDGFTIVMTTHNPNHPLLLGGRVALLNNQGHLTVGDAQDVLTEQVLSELYEAQLHMVHIDKLRRDCCLPDNL